MPGGIWTPLQRHWSPERLAAAQEQARGAEAAGVFRMRTPEQGAATAVYLAASGEVAGTSGEFFIDERPVLLPAAARDDEAARRLWEISARMTGLPAD